MSAPRPASSPVIARFFFSDDAPFTKLLELCTADDCPSSIIECSVRRRYPGDSACPAGFASMIRPVTAAPRPARTRPFTRMGSSSTASNLSPECAVALEIEDSRCTVTGVPEGTRAPGGITALVGEIPPFCPSRSKGSCSPSPAGAEEAATGTADWWPHPTRTRASASARVVALQAFIGLIFSAPPHVRKSQGRCQLLFVETKPLTRCSRTLTCISYGYAPQECSARIPGTLALRRARKNKPEGDFPFGCESCRGKCRGTTSSLVPSFPSLPRGLSLAPGPSWSPEPS